MPVSETAAIMTMAKAALDTVLNVGQLIAKGASKKELKEHVDQLTQHLHELTKKVTELHRSNLLLNEEVDRLKQQLKTGDEFFFDRETGSYWRKTDDGQRDGPFARSACMEPSGKPCHWCTSRTWISSVVPSAILLRPARVRR